MDLYDRIESTRFVGREFLVWIWWKSELFEGEMELRDFGPSEVWIDDQLILEARGEDVEQSRFKGGSPSSSPEAKESLRQGKVPTKARISISRDTRDFSFVIDAESFALSGVKTPALLQDEKEERFYERMYLLEELEEMLSALFSEFLILRVSPSWGKTIAPAIRAWVRDEPKLTQKGYLKIVERLTESTPKKTAKPKTVPAKKPQRSPAPAKTTSSKTLSA